MDQELCKKQYETHFPRQAFRIEFYRFFAACLHHLEQFWSPSWTILGTCLAQLGLSWAVLELSWDPLGHLGTILAALGGSWAVLGQLLAALGRVLNLKITRDAILSTGVGPKYP